MRNLNVMNDHQLVSATGDAVKNERASTAEVVRHFQEIVDRKIYLKRGYPSMFEMVTRYYGYCNGSAQRHINSMRLVKDLPEVAAKLEPGELSLTAAATVQSFFYAEKKENKNYSKAQKLEVVEACLKLSVNEVHRELAKRNPQLAKKEFKRTIDEDQIRISFNITNELDKKIEHLKSLMSHTTSNMKMDELLERLVEIGLDKLDPVRKAKRAIRKEAAAGSHKNYATNSASNGTDKSLINTTSLAKPATSHAASLEPTLAHATTPPSIESEGIGKFGPQTPATTLSKHALPLAEVKRTRYISASARHALWSDHDGQGCEYIDGETSQRCCSKHFLQIEHVVPFSMGGSHAVSNLKVLCGEHNRDAWRELTDPRVH